ncbi:MAG TPA: plastocyanin/azurin family copper-binding protein, partial [Solirubrobacteraceae bacterium]|nr:plastocyanin/azurin family copper-binding protein [Solirubrobacteraceae bacterium]
AAATTHEKSKTAFYIAGGALAGWAVLVGVFGFTHPDFPGSQALSRAVMATSLVLMLSAVSAAAITGSTPPPAPRFVHVKLPLKGTAPPLTPTVSSTAPAAASAPAPKLPAGALALAADPNGTLKFDQTSLTAAKAGKVTIAFTNASPIGHNLAVTKAGKVLGMTPIFQGGGTKDLVLTLAAGTYTFLCTVPGHAAAGMQGTLTVP